MNPSRRRAGYCLGAAVIALVATACTPTNPPPPPPPPPVVTPVVASTVPLANTPNFTGPAGSGSTVDAITQVGDRLVVGGDFTAVNSKAHKYLATFVAPTGPVDGFAPALNGDVQAVTPNATGNGYYAAGHFSSVGGFGTHVALFTTAGQLVTSFKVSANGVIRSLALVSGHLLIGGEFTNLGGANRGGLASVNPATGAVDNYLTVPVTGHHNFGRIPNAAEAGVGVYDIAVSPDKTRAIVDGNFINAGGFARDQIFNLKLGGTSATVDPNWATAAYTKNCQFAAYDSYVRHISWSPDGSYFVVVATGGYKSGSLEDCDAASRFNASSTGTNVAPAWIDWTGTDSLYSVAVTAGAVYVGGHNRWLNNPYGQDSPHQGAVPRPGLAALEPANGVPMAWNPGRHPRGHGAEVVYASPTGIWVGSDTDYIGNFQYQRDELAFFPFAGGTSAPADNTGNASKILVGGKPGSSSNTLAAYSLNTATGGGAPTVAPASGGIAWSSVRGAFTLNGRIFYGTSSGQFISRTWNGSTFGPAQSIDPYNDPYWSNVVNGSPPTGTTYRGSPSSFYAELPKVTAMFYANRSIYYTLAGNPRLFKRAFSPSLAQSSSPGQLTGGVVNPLETTVVNAGGLVSFINAGGLFVANGKLWLTGANNGHLYQIPWNGSTVTGPAKQLTTAGSWAGRAVFTAP
jgi:hypothetical protein